MEKLVRDRIPEIMKMQGQTAKIRIAESFEYEEFLFKKLLEEVNEFISSPSLEELADIQEVLETIKTLKGFDSDQIQKVQIAKRTRSGSFNKKIILDTQTS
jgi:predicted house-cleaning noncanonical NTP pyrophosphatase (MazG superfamily)